MARVEKSINVNVPLGIAYNQWTQFEEFPRFMDDVKEVRQLDEKRLHWVAGMGGKAIEWDAVITEQVPDNRIAWQNTNGRPNAGHVTFHEIDEENTQVTLRMEYEPEGFIENAADRLGFVERRVTGDLERFKHFIETRGQETGAWRGEIRGAETVSPGGSSRPSGPVNSAGSDHAGSQFVAPSPQTVTASAPDFAGAPAQGSPVVQDDVSATRSGVAAGGAMGAVAGIETARSIGAPNSVGGVDAGVTGSDSPAEWPRGAASGATDLEPGRSGLSVTNQNAANQTGLGPPPSEDLPRRTDAMPDAAEFSDTEPILAPLTPSMRPVGVTNLGFTGPGSINMDFGNAAQPRSELAGSPADVEAVAETGFVEGGSGDMGEQGIQPQRADAQRTVAGTDPLRGGADGQNEPTGASESRTGAPAVRHSIAER